MSRIEKEKQTVEQMIRLYCRKKEGNGTLCPQCRELLEYAQTRLSRCPFGDGKSTCRICTACHRGADPAYGTGVAKALGIDLDAALKETR